MAAGQTALMSPFPYRNRPRAVQVRIGDDQREVMRSWWKNRCCWGKGLQEVAFRRWSSFVPPLPASPERGRCRQNRHGGVLRDGWLRRLSPAVLPLLREAPAAAVPAAAGGGAVHQPDLRHGGARGMQGLRAEHPVQ